MCFIGPHFLPFLLKNKPSVLFLNLMWSKICLDVIFKDFYNECLGFPSPGPRPSAPKRFSSSSTSSYLKFTHYDHVLLVYGLFKACWLTHATCTCFKETALLFNVHLSYFMNFILCPNDTCSKFTNSFLETVVALSTAKTTRCLLCDTYVLFNK